MSGSARDERALRLSRLAAMAISLLGPPLVAIGATYVAARLRRLAAAVISGPGRAG